MAISENTKKVLEFLKANNGKKVTSADVAEAIGIEKRSVDGVFTGLQKKGLGVRVDGTTDGAKEISLLSITNEGTTCDRKDMSENAVKILDYLTSVQGEKVTLDDMAAALEADKRAINGAFNALVKKGFCARTSVKVAAQVPVKYLELTAEGNAFDPNATDAE